MVGDSVLRAVALMGATGTGKSALAMDVAKQTGSAIICCDSMQLYRGLDIGTAKPEQSERAQVPHYLVDCCELPDLYSAVRWADEAKTVIKAENAQGRTPLIVGGTGFYLKALLEGFAQIPADRAGVRGKYESLHNEGGAAKLYELLSQRDPVMAARLKANDSQRIMRALCVLESSGVSLAVWQEKAAAEFVPVDCSLFVLDVERDILRERLAERFRQMMQQDWLKEVEWLMGLELNDTHPAMRAVGYRQLMDHLLGLKTREQAVIDGITATRRYAKRQVTWFNNQTPDALHGSAQDLKERLKKRLTGLSE